MCSTARGCGRVVPTRAAGENRCRSPGLGLCHSSVWYEALSGEDGYSLDYENYF